ncbi:NUDIX hydrolase [Cognatishimia maritima]|uniref:8-oxo-dGTP pyrophosphatase MutT, NUDIX family n=1 Tax=Cognatishimia maritima TaxID=870908 RepID=A0A1M5UCT9_9RHOB|nr:NUDIX hydrolase [Cognatishimia maritima]SHH60875.1 8-oxo-dGTP pyrophosphatase MutT, NUDIX family [Cognatishimia maritima]
MSIDKTAIRDAATVIVLRDRETTPQVLMGQRGSKAAFMPNKFVFPGGAVDKDDHHVPLATPPSDINALRLAEDLRPETSPTIGTALFAAAIRELWEETGLILGTKAPWPEAPGTDWEAYANTGHLPHAGGLKFVFRAITPPGRPRRFDARFFLVDAADLSGDIDDFSRASDELSHLQWVPLSEARSYDLPFITEVVLAEVEGRLHEKGHPATVPFFRNTDEAGLFTRLYGRPPTKADLGG